MIAHKRGLNLNDVQEINRGLVIWLLRRKRVCSRAEIAKSSGLKQATITNIINDFINWGIVRETGIIEGRKGRRSIGITLDTDHYRVMGIRITRHFFAVGLFDLFGRQDVISHQQIDLTEGGPAVIGKLITAVAAMLEQASDRKVLGIGVAIPGPYVRTEGKMSLMTEHPGWEGIAIDQELASAFELPVHLEHDAKAGALAEWWFASRKFEQETMVYIAAGQGIGAGIIINGKLIRGALGIAGEVGHISIAFDGPRCACGNCGCLEHYCSTIALARYAEEGIRDHPASALARDRSFPRIVQALKAGDPFAHEIVSKAGRFLGLGLVSLINAYNPHVIIVGDEMSQLGEVFLEVIRGTIESHVLPTVYRSTSIELCPFEHDPVLVGVSTLTVDQILHTPLVPDELG